MINLFAKPFFICNIIAHIKISYFTMRTLFLPLLFLIFFSIAVNAQNDSILKYIKQCETKSGYEKDTNYIFAINTVAENYWRNEKLDEANTYAKKALVLSQSANYLLGEGTAYNAIGIVYWYRGSYDSAIASFQKSLPIVTKLNNKKGIASCLNNIGMLHATKGEDPLALSFFFKALKIHEEAQNYVGMSSCYNNIGIIYKNQKEYDKALVYYFKSLKSDEQSGEEANQTGTLNNIGVLYDLKLLPDSALYYYSKAIVLHEKEDNQAGLGSIYINMGLIQFSRKKYPEAEDCFKKAIESAQLGDQKYVVAEAYASLGDLYLLQNNLKESITCLNKANSIAFEIEATPIQRDVALRLSQYYKKINNIPLALKYLETHMQIKDSLFNEETRESTLKMQLQYEYEKKELKDSVKYEKITAKKDLELATERSTKYLLYGGIIFCIVVSFVSFKAYANKRAANKEISAQKEQIEVQKSIVEIKQKEIIDSISYAKRLQDAILPSEKILQEHFPQHFILYKPKDIVAGDFYWFEMVDGVKFIAAADCTGHGVPGAMVSVVCSNALNRAVLEFGMREPGEILNKTRELVLDTFSKNDDSVRDGMDISLCSISQPVNAGDSFKIQWSGANNPLWYFQNGSFNQIKPHKQAVGKTENASPFPTHTMELNAGDVLYLITDGYGDQFGGPQGKKYKSQKLQTTIASVCEKPVKNQKEFLNTTFENWKNNLEQIDDVTIIGIVL